MINEACGKFIGRYGVAKLGIAVEKIDQFAGKATVSMSSINADLLLQFWSALSFFPSPTLRLSILDFTLHPVPN